MPDRVEYKPVRDDVPMVAGAIAVGEDLEFQRRWWRFERAIWTVFALIVVADLAGALGRGPLANAERRSSDGTLRVKYERIERANTSSIITVTPEARAIQNGKFRLFVSDSVLKELGGQRVIPQPEVSAVGDGGVTYTFSATEIPVTVQMELKPSFVGLHPFTLTVPGAEPVQAKVFVLP